MFYESRVASMPLSWRHFQVTPGKRALAGAASQFVPLSSRQFDMILGAAVPHVLRVCGADDGCNAGGVPEWPRQNDCVKLASCSRQ